jgi:hypothetical protein
MIGRAGRPPQIVDALVGGLFDSRGSLWEIARKTSDPEKALRNLLERDQMFTERLCEEAGRLELRVIEVDATMTEDDLAERVTEAFGL